jgi:putative endonuclease
VRAVRAGTKHRDRRELGRLGERRAAAHLESLGFRVLERNARTRYGEIDLIAFDGRTLAFVEVKTRRARASQIGQDPQPLAALAWQQRARLRRLAAARLRRGPRKLPYASAIRFDAIGVLLGAHGELMRLDHVEAAW